MLTLYAASRKDLEIWAFEPAAVNYYNLTANCEINGWSKAVHCLLLGFGDPLRLAELNVSQLQSAESFSFKAKKRDNPTDRQTTIIWTIDGFIEQFGVACPNYIKIDVPGLASEVLLGASHTLSRPEIKQIQIEVQEGNASYEWTSDFLANRGFQLVQRSTERGQLGDVVFGRSKNTMSTH